MFDFSFALFGALKMKNINKQNKNEKKQQQQMVKDYQVYGYSQLCQHIKGSNISILALTPMELSEYLTKFRQIWTSVQPLENYVILK